jgi:hypothetical protein
MSEKINHFQKVIPWYILGVCTLLLLFLPFFLLRNISFYKSSVIVGNQTSDAANYLTVYLVMIKRSAGIIIGVTISIIGLLSSLIKIPQTEEVEEEEKPSTLMKSVYEKLSLIALILGIFLVWASIIWKG